MATKTVLQYVQACLSTMDSDEVDSIAETSESMQIAELLPDIYAELINRQEWEFLRRPVTLTAVGNPELPTKFVIPTGLRRLTKLWYNVSTTSVSRRELCYVEPEDFLSRLASGDTAANKMLVTDGSQLQFYVRNDRMPSLYTTFDDRAVWCDAYDAAVETTLQSSKISAWGVVIPSLVVADDTVPDLPEHMVPLLQSLLNAAAHRYFKQQVSEVDEARAHRQLAQARTRNSVVASREHYYSNRFGR